MTFEWEERKTRNKNGQQIAKVSTKFYNEKSFITITEKVAPDSVNHSYSLFYQMTPDIQPCKKMQGMCKFPKEIDTMEKAKSSAEVYLRNMLQKRYEKTCMYVEELKEALYPNSIKKTKGMKIDENSKLICGSTQ